MDRKDIGLKPWNRGVLGHVLVLSLMLTVTYYTYLTFEELGAAQENTWGQVMVSGRQRMLSQRIHLLAERYLDSRNSAEGNLLRIHLLNAANLMERSHDGLINGNPSLGLSGNPTPELRTLYFGPLGFIDRDIKSLVNNARMVATSSDVRTVEEHPHLISVLETGQDQLLKDLGTIILQYQKDGQGRILSLQLKAIVTISLSLILLMVWSYGLYSWFLQPAKRQGGEVESTGILVMRKFLVFFLPLTALFTAEFVAFQNFRSGVELAAMENQAGFHIEMGAGQLNMDFEIFGSDLLVIAGSEALDQLFVENTSQARKDVEDRFLQFAKDRKLYDQIRYLDGSGNEMVRVNYQSGNPQIIPQSQLQNKAGRYYFTETMALPPQGVFISPLDLNVEQGVVENPNKPIIRISKPVFDRFGKEKGIVILNYLANRLIERLDSTQIGFAGELQFLNQDGHWFRGPEKEDEWGFMFGSQRSFATLYPSEWENIRSALVGQFQTDNGLFTFTTFFPKLQIQRATSSPLQIAAINDGSGRERDLGYWKIVSRVYPFNVGFFGQLVNQPLVLLFYVSLMGLLAFVCWRLAGAMVRRIRAEEALRNSEERWRGFASASFEGLLVHDNGLILEANEKLVAMFGYRIEELRGFHIQELVAPRLLELVRKDLMQVSGTFEVEGCRKNGSCFPIELSSRPIAFMGKNQAAVAIRDLSERKQTEEVLRQAQKMEVIGVLSGGIAHDFNNILTPILGYTEIAKMTLPTDSKAQAHLDAIHRGAIRAKDLVSQILLFSRQNQSERRPLQFKPLVKEVLKLMRSALPKMIEIQERYDPELPKVAADSTQIHTLLMNLCTNAGHAMPDGGVLTVGLKRTMLFECEMYDGQKISGEFVRLTVADSGEGMDRETMSRIFDPFFTTKEVGKGTGLGLSTVYGIVQHNHGHIAVGSTLGEGTVFDIYFPLLNGVSESNDVSISEPTLKGREFILFIDDEEDIVSSIQMGLAPFGYQVSGFTNPVEALAHLRLHPRKFDLIITANTMGLMSGEKVTEEVSNMVPGLPIILCTGNNEPQSRERMEALGIDCLVQKPYGPLDLGRMIRLIMDKAGENSLPPRPPHGLSPQHEGLNDNPNIFANWDS